MINYINIIISFTAYGIYLALERYFLKLNIYTRNFNFFFLTIGVGGILFACITEIYYLEYFFVLLITMSLLNLWKERKKRRR